MELAQTRTPYGVEDQRWLDNTEGLRQPLPVTLDGTLFTSAHFPNGVIPSGTVIGLAASGLGGPYNNAAGDSTATAVGILIDTCLVGAGRTAGAGKDSVVLMTTGAVISNKLPTLASADGALDTAAKADLPLIRFRTV